MNRTSDIGSNDESPALRLLGGNGRVIMLNLLGGIGLLVLAAFLALTTTHWGMQVISTIAAICGFSAAWFSWLFYTTPRLAITDTELLVYLGRNCRQPFHVPLDIVEVFFIGQGAVTGSEPGQPHGYEGAVAANVVVRLAEAATTWHQRDVQPLLGVWDDGYITVRGLFCENIDQNVLKEMNRELLTRKRRLRGSSSHD